MDKSRTAKANRQNCEACRGNVVDGKSCYACGIKGPAGEGWAMLVADLRAELAEARKAASECKECAGTGIMDVVVSWTAPDGDEVCKPEMCAECEGTGIGVFGQTIRALAVAEDALRAAGFTLVGGEWTR